MKLKIIFFPIALVVVIWLSIFVIKPEIFVIKDKMSLLEVKKVELENIIKKQGTIDSLVGNLNSKADREKIIIDYLPVNREEEEVINKIYQRAIDAKTKISSLSVTEGSPETGQTAATAPVSSDDDLEVMPKNKLIGAQAVVVGTYDQIRQFFKYVYAMEKLNSIHSLNIKQEMSTGEGAEAGVSKLTGKLTADMTLSFDFSPALKVNKDKDLPIFSRPDFDFTIADKVEKLLAEKVAAVKTDTTGKKNPFTP